MAHHARSDPEHAVAPRRVELGVEGPDAAVGGRNEDPRGQHEVGDGGHRGRGSDAAVPSHADDNPEGEHRQGLILFGEKDESDAHREPDPAPPGGEPIGKQQRSDPEGIGMELEAVDPLERRIQQVGRHHGDREPVVAETVARQKPHRDGANGDRRRLHEEKELRAGPEPVERHERQRGVVRVVPEVVESPDSDERFPESRQQPDSLVEDPHVEAEGAEVAVLNGREPAEHDDVRSHHGDKGGDAQAQPPSMRGRAGIDGRRHGRVDCDGLGQPVSFTPHLLSANSSSAL